MAHLTLSLKAECRGWVELSNQSYFMPWHTQTCGAKRVAKCMTLESDGEGGRDSKIPDRQTGVRGMGRNTNKKLMDQMCTYLDVDLCLLTQGYAFDAVF